MKSPSTCFLSLFALLACSLLLPLQSPLSSPPNGAIAVAVAVAVAAAGVVAAPLVHARDPASCLGAPYFYITFHGSSTKQQGEMEVMEVKGEKKGGTGVNSVYRYSRDGCLLSEAIDTSGPVQLSELRSMLLTNDSKLLVTNSNKDLSSILVFSNCSSDSPSNLRTYVSNFVSQDQDGGLLHPYGLAYDPYGNVYVTNQDTNALLRFYGPSSSQPGAPIPSQGGSYPGAFFQDGEKGGGIRGLAYVPEVELWFVADENADQLFILDNAGLNLQNLTVHNPIGVMYDATSQLLFVGSATSSAKVVAIDPLTLEVVHTYTVAGMTHPAGLTVYEGVLYVLEQDLGQLLSFEIETATLQSVVIDSFPDQVEQILLAPC